MSTDVQQVADLETRPFNPSDAEDCDACVEVDDECRYHQGFAAGEEYAREQSWPEGVVARHLTWAGEFLRDLELTVDVADGAGGRAAVCRGCGDEFSRFSGRPVSEWAREHAVGCRALPRPGVA